MNLLWTVLPQIRTLLFQALSLTGRVPGWDGFGDGTVGVQEEPGTIIFQEQGTFTTDRGSSFAFTNAFRWTLLPDAVRLEHLRYGTANPVHLFDLVPDGPTTWTSGLGHQCRDDCYSATITLTDTGFTMLWTISGPKKAARLTYTYRRDETASVQEIVREVVPR